MDSEITTKFMVFFSFAENEKWVNCCLPTGSISNSGLHITKENCSFQKNQIPNVLLSTLGLI